MKYKKVQTTILTSGQTRQMDLGWADDYNINSDIGRERERFARLAVGAERNNREDRKIQSVEVAGETVVVIYESGEVRIVNYVEEAP